MALLGLEEAGTLELYELVLRDLGERETDCPVMKGRTVLPILPEAQIRQAVPVIPANYWNISCWNFLLEGNSTFSYPYLSVEQRLYFSYQYYTNQMEANPKMASYLQEPLQCRLSKHEEKSGVAK